MIRTPTGPHLYGTCNWLAHRVVVLRCVKCMWYIIARVQGLLRCWGRDYSSVGAGCDLVRSHQEGMACIHTRC